MGNIVSLQPQEQEVPHTMENIKPVLEKLRTQINSVDHAVTGLARAIDIMQLNCQLLVSSRKGTSGKGEAEHILEIIQDLILDSKTVVVKSVANFLDFVIDNVNKFCGDDDRIKITSLEVNKYCPESQRETTKQDIIREYFIRRIDSLKLENSTLQDRNDQMEKQLNELHTRMQTYIEENKILKNDGYERYNQTHDPNDWNEKNEYTEGNINSKQRTAGDLSQELPDANTKPTELEGENKSEIKVCKQKIEPYAAEKEKAIDQTALLHSKSQEFCKVKEKIAKLENTEKDECIMSDRICTKPMSPGTDISSEKMMKKIQILEKKYTEEKEGRMRAETKLETLSAKYEEIKSLEKKFKQLTTQQYKKTATVQICRHSKFMESAEEAQLLHRLKTKFSSLNITLEKKVCHSSANVVEDLVVLGFVNHDKRSKKNKTIDNFLTEFSGSFTKLAVIVFHHSNDHGTEKEVETYEKEHDSVSLVVHVGHLTGLSNSKRNANSVESLLKFIQENSALESSL